MSFNKREAGSTFTPLFKSMLFVPLSYAHGRASAWLPGVSRAHPHLSNTVSNSLFLYCVPLSCSWPSCPSCTPCYFTGLAKSLLQEAFLGLLLFQLFFLPQPGTIAVCQSDWLFLRLQTSPLRPRLASLSKWAQNPS